MANADGGTQMVYGTDNGVYLANLLAKEKSPIKVIAVPNVTQVDVLEDYGILVVLAGERFPRQQVEYRALSITIPHLDKAVQTFVLDSLDPNEAIVAAKRARKISTNASFFKTGVCLNRTLVCIVKSGTVSSTIMAGEARSRLLFANSYRVATTFYEYIRSSTFPPNRVRFTFSRASCALDAPKASKSLIWTLSIRKVCWTLQTRP
jgi:hypothetical protein